MNAGDGIDIGVGIVLTLTLGAVLWYAWEARKQAKAGERMAKEMIETRHGGVLPVIDFIAEAGRGVDLIARALQIQEGILPETLHGHLKNIGSAPALDIQFQIKLPDTEPSTKRVPRVGVGEYVQDELTRTHDWHIYLHPIGESAKRLSVEFHNVYGRAYHSWREVAFDRETGNTKVGHLHTEPMNEGSAK
jgi:hypothetical protein